MASKAQTLVQKQSSSFSKFLKLPSSKQLKNGPSSKKIFSRKPLNHSQNNSKILLGRLKTQEQDQNIQNIQNLIGNSGFSLFNQSKSIKFMSTKGSNSLQKLFISCSISQLSRKMIFNKKQTKNLGPRDDNSKNQNNQKIKSAIFCDNNTAKSKVRVVGYLEQEEDNLNDNIESTQLSSSGNLGCQELIEDEIQSKHHLNRCKKYQTCCINGTKEKEHLKKCPNCFINLRKIKYLEERNRQLANIIESKDLEIKKLNKKIQKMAQTSNQNQTYLKSLQHEVQILKEKQIICASQKKEIQRAYQNLQLDYSKLTQQTRYKDLELNISKVYKTKSLEMQMKVEILKYQLNKTKFNFHKIFSSKSSVRLRNSRSKPDLSTKAEKYERQNSEKRLIKQPKIAKVYSQDSVFSLSSQD